MSVIQIIRQSMRLNLPMLKGYLSENIVNVSATWAINFGREQSVSLGLGERERKREREMAKLLLSKKGKHLLLSLNKN